MIIELNLSNIDTERIFVIGEIRGSYHRMIDILFDQRFTHKDILVAAGNFIDPESSSSKDLVYFLKNGANTYAIMGKREKEFLSEEISPSWAEDSVMEFLSELPLRCQVSHKAYVVNSGIQPGLSLEDQDPEVFYSIKGYDKDSRFYQFDNPEKKSWYDFEFFQNSERLDIIFGGESSISGIEVPAGYFIGRGADSKLRCLILEKRHGSYIIVEG